MMDADGTDRITRPDLTKYPAPPVADADYWQPYDPYATHQPDPLAGLDPTYPPYPVAYPQIPYPGGNHPGMYSPNPFLMAPYLAQPRTNAMATGAMICSLLAIPGMFFCLGFVLAPAGLILGIVGLGQIKNRPYETGESQAWTGVILGGLLTFLSVLVVVLWFAFVVAVG